MKKKEEEENNNSNNNNNRACTSTLDKIPRTYKYLQTYTFNRSAIVPTPLPYTVLLNNKPKREDELRKSI